MKKIIFIIGLTFLLTGCFAKYENFNLIISETEGDNCELIQIADEYGRKIKSYCLDFIKIEKSDETIHDLSIAISAEEVFIEDLLSVMEKKEVLYDGGTTIYEGKNYNIFSCQDMSGTNDLIIARKDIEFNEKLCKKSES